jgi:heme/copper-type cytochrome/quinol oxidase subunit 3
MIDRVGTLERADQHKLGMLVFIASEAVFFAILILTYVYYRPAWTGRIELGANRLDVGLVAIFTVALLASSATIWLAERSQRRGRGAAMRGWLFATIALGAVFLVGQGLEYAKLIAEGVTISTNLFGTTFYTLTGFHGLHVFGGLVALTILFGLALAGANAFDDPHSTALETISLYWHFVDVVWIAVFSVIYLGALAR